MTQLGLHLLPDDLDETSGRRRRQSIPELAERLERDREARAKLEPTLDWDDVPDGPWKELALKAAAKAARRVRR